MQTTSQRNDFGLEIRVQIMDIGSTVDAITEAAKEFRNTADKLDKIAQSMSKKVDLSYTAEAIIVMTNALNVARIDLLVTRPIRAYEKVINDGI